MVGLACAPIPRVQAFCRATRPDGTIGRAQKAPDTVLSRGVIGRFDTNVRDLARISWRKNRPTP